MIDGRPGMRGFINQARNASYTFTEALCELIDNCIDAGCTQVLIHIGEDMCGDRVLLVRDDGHGMPDVESCLVHSKHIGHGTGGVTSGRYGVGLKDASMWVSGTTTIESKTPGRDPRRLVVDWDDMAASNSWEIADAQPAMDWCGGDHGTEIVLHLNRDRRLPSPSVIDKIEKIYQPALRRGVEIVVEHGGTERTLEVRPEPALQESVDKKLKIACADGITRVAYLVAGYTIQPNDIRGILIEHCHKYINIQNPITDVTPRSAAKPCPAHRISGRITVDESWPVTNRKDGFASDNDMAALVDAIRTACGDVFCGAQAVIEEYETDLICRDLEDKLGELFADDGKTQRELRVRIRCDEPGEGVKPVGTGRKRRRAARTTECPGSVHHGERNAARGFRFIMDSLGPDGGVGYTQDNDGEPLLVVLNSDCGLIRGPRATHDTQLMAVFHIVDMHVISAPPGRLYPQDNRREPGALFDSLCLREFGLSAEEVMA